MKLAVAAAPNAPYPEPKSNAYASPAAVSTGDASAAPVSERTTGLPSTPPGGDSSVAVGATLRTVTSIGAVVAAAEPLDASRAVAVTVRTSGASAGRLSGRVKVRPASWAGVSDHEPSPLSAPADRPPPAGTPATVTDSDSEPSVSVNAAAIDSGMAAFSSPAAVAPTVRLGASATAATVTVTMATLDSCPKASRTV